MGNYPEQDCKKLKQLGRMTKVKNYLSLIKFSHTIFALPFALIGFFLALFSGFIEHGHWNLNETIGWGQKPFDPGFLEHYEIGRAHV